MKWLRYGIASTFVASSALGAFLVACGDDDSGATASDAGSDNNQPADTGGGTDSGGSDAGGDGGQIVPAKIIVVHAAHDYGANTDSSGAVRVCYATKASTNPDYALSPLPPLPHSVEDGGAATMPGIPIGAGGPFPSTGIPLESLAIRPYIVSAKALYDRGVVGQTGLATTARCNNLLSGNYVPDGGFANDAGALEANKDYWQLPDIAPGTFKNGKTYMLAIYGCAQSSNAFAGKCGGSYVPDGGPGVGNLTVVVLELDATTAVQNTELGAQVVNLSPEHATAHNQADAAFPSFEPIIFDPADAGGSVRFVSPDGGRQEVPFTTTPNATPMAKVTGFVSNKGYFAANANESLLAVKQPYLPIPMNNSAVQTPPTIQYIVEGKATPNAAELYVNGKTYTFVLVGDIDDAAQGLRKIHFLGFPNVFTPPPAN